MNYRFAAHAHDSRKRLPAIPAAGAFGPLIDAGRYQGLERVADGVERLLAGRNTGKVVVDLDE